MKENELRIGNYIQLYRRPIDFKKTKHKIKSIFFDDIENKYFVELEDGFIVNADKGIVPIPLTEEMLLSFGLYVKFENMAGKIYGFVDDKNHSIDAHITAPKDDPIKFRNREIYLHDLQNIYFALTGKELPIILSEI